jgi:hypothetical protein
MGSDTFTITEDHLKLLRRFIVGWQDCETGAPEIDPKRPYGNSDVPLDVAEILGWPTPNEETMSGREYDAARETLRERAMTIHCETRTALEIVLRTGIFEPGTYERVGWRTWSLVG